MTAIFSEYAGFYDILYRDKDYPGESSFVDALIRRHRPGPGPLRLLDLACGTGRHAIELAGKGYEIEGSDIASAMVDKARESAAGRGLNLRFHNHSFQTSDRIGGRFDVVISMFSAVGYLLTYEDFALTLSNVRGLMAPGSVFIFDYWNGNAVLRDYSPVKFLRKKSGQDEILRISETRIDPVAQWADVKFTCMGFSGDIRKQEFEETHRVRFFFFREMEALLAASGFRILATCPFMHPDKPVQSHDWNISVVAAPAG